jgi:hypothetical protein
MGDIDGYQLPDAKGYSQFSRWAAFCAVVTARLTFGV